MKHDYSEIDIINALKKVGLVEGDSIFVHSNIGFFGRLRNAANEKDYYNIFKTAIFKVIGEHGTIVVPTFSYSFCLREIYDRYNTPSVCGMFSEMIRKDTNSIRSDDPNFSVAALGNKAKYFTENTPEHSFGRDSFWDKFIKVSGKICNFNFDAGSTFIHYVEKTIGVSYRYDKLFYGVSIINGIEKKRGFYHYVYDLENKSNMSNFVKFDQKAKMSGIVRIANLGKGQIVLISAKDTFSLIEKELKHNHRFLIADDSNSV